MKDKNFDNLKNINIPDSWISKATDIPNTHKKETPVFYIRHSKSIVAAACLVLVCIISITVAVHKSSLVAKPNNNETTTATVNICDPTKSAENESSDIQESTNTPTQKSTQSTENNSENEPDPTEEAATDNTNGDAPNEDHPDNPLKPNGSGSSSTVSPSRPSTPSTVAPTAPPETTPTSAPSTNLPDEPTTPDTDPDKNESKPNGSPSLEPEAPAGENFVMNCVVPIESGDTFYCVVYDPYSQALGDSNLFSSDHIATVIYSDQQNTILSFSIKKYNPTITGIYTFCFYNENAETLYSGNLYVECN